MRKRITVNHNNEVLVTTIPSVVGKYLIWNYSYGDGTGYVDVVLERNENEYLRSSSKRESIANCIRYSEATFDDAMLRIRDYISDRENRFVSTATIGQKIAVTVKRLILENLL